MTATVTASAPKTTATDSSALLRSARPVESQIDESKRSVAASTTNRTARRTSRIPRSNTRTFAVSENPATAFQNPVVVAPAKSSTNDAITMARVPIPAVAGLSETAERRNAIPPIVAA